MSLRTSLKGMFLNASNCAAHSIFDLNVSRSSRAAGFPALISAHNSSWEARVTGISLNFRGIKGCLLMAWRTSSPIISPLPRAVIPLSPLRASSSGPLRCMPLYATKCPEKSRARTKISKWGLSSPYWPLRKAQYISSMGTVSLSASCLKKYLANSFCLGFTWSSY